MPSTKAGRSACRRLGISNNEVMKPHFLDVHEACVAGALADLTAIPDAAAPEVPAQAQANSAAQRSRASPQKGDSRPGERS